MAWKAFAFYDQKFGMASQMTLKVKNQSVVLKQRLRSGNQNNVLAAFIKRICKI